MQPLAQSHLRLVGSNNAAKGPASQFIENCRPSPTCGRRTAIYVNAKDTQASYRLTWPDVR